MNWLVAAVFIAAVATTAAVYVKLKYHPLKLESEPLYKGPSTVVFSAVLTEAAYDAELPLLCAKLIAHDDPNHTIDERALLDRPLTCALPRDHEGECMPMTFWQETQEVQLEQSASRVGVGWGS